MTRSNITTTFADPGNFEPADVKEAVGEVSFDGIAADEPNDCDHRAAEASCGEVRCVDCGKRLG